MPTLNPHDCLDTLRTAAPMPTLYTPPVSPTPSPPPSNLTSGNNNLTLYLGATPDNLVVLPTTTLNLPAGKYYLLPNGTRCPVGHYLDIHGQKQPINPTAVPEGYQPINLKDDRTKEIVGIGLIPDAEYHELQKAYDAEQKAKAEQRKK